MRGQLLIFTVGRNVITATSSNSPFQLFLAKCRDRVARPSLQKWLSRSSPGILFQHLADDFAGVAGLLEDVQLLLGAGAGGELGD